MPIIKFESEWLKANENVKVGDHVKFLDEGRQDEKGQWVFKVVVIRNGERSEKPRKFSLNKKNFNAISKAYGPDSDKWVDKEMRVSVIKVENPKTGELVPAVRLTAPGLVEDGLEEDARLEDLPF